MNTKEKIIRTSIALFNLHGERAITTNHIASNLGISPGNLYYHFKNKEDIIRNIFTLYREHLSTHFKPLDTSHEPLEQLTQYLDSLFELMWRYHFFYDNLTDILAKDSDLKKQYIEFQADLFNQVRSVVIGLRSGQEILAAPAHGLRHLHGKGGGEQNRRQRRPEDQTPMRDGRFDEGARDGHAVVAPVRTEAA